MRTPSLKQQFPCHQCPFNNHKSFRAMNGDEIEFMEGFKKGELQVQSGSTFMVEGNNSPHLYTVLSGWAFRYKTLADGRRQILNYIMPGDFIGLQGGLLQEMQHSIQAMSDMLLCVFERGSLFSLFQRNPSLSYDVTWLAAREEQILDEHLLSVGRRTALERSAYLISFIHARAGRVNLFENPDILAPFTQTHVADTLGLSLVHTNKTLRTLQQRDMIEWVGKSCRIKSTEELSNLANWEGLPDVERPYI
ncbi:MAG: Crp/Fnr family transcriptional regulator [Pseudomonadota bacterium]